MRALRIVVAGLVAVAAMVAVFFAAMLVFFTGLAAYFLQLFRGRPAPVRPATPPASDRQSGATRTGEVIDVVTTKVSSGPDGG